MENQNAEKSELEMLYEEYLNDDERYLVINGKPYYKIIKKMEEKIHDFNVSIIIPRALLENAKSLVRICDEHGRVFSVIGPELIRPKRMERWCIETYIYFLRDIKNAEEIGDYVTFLS